MGVTRVRGLVARSHCAGIARVESSDGGFGCVVRDSPFSLFIGGDRGCIRIAVIYPDSKVRYSLWRLDMRSICFSIRSLANWLDAARDAIICICCAIMVSNSDFLIDLDEATDDVGEAA